MISHYYISFKVMYGILFVALDSCNQNTATTNITFKYIKFTYLYKSLLKQ